MMDNVKVEGAGKRAKKLIGSGKFGLRCDKIFVRSITYKSYVFTGFGTASLIEDA